MASQVAKFSVQELSDGRAVVSRGKAHFMTLPSRAQADEIKKLVADAQGLSVEPERLVYALAKALGVESRLA